MNKLIRQIKSTTTSILFPKFKNRSDLSIVVYSDASYRNLESGASQGAYIVFLSDGESCCPLTWSSARVKRVVKSTIAAETLALSEGCDAAFMMSRLVSEVITGRKETTLPITSITDNRSLFEAAHTTNVLSDKRLQFEISSIREMIEKNEITLEWTEAKNQLSDVLTKCGASSIHLRKVLEQGHF